MGHEFAMCVGICGALIAATPRSASAREVVRLFSIGFPGETAAVGVSAHGNHVAVSVRGDGPDRSYIWSPGFEAEQVLEPLGGFEGVQGRDLSADGRALLASTFAPVSYLFRPAVSMDGGRAAALPEFPGYQDIIPLACSGDGGVIVGEAFSPLISGFRFDAAGYAALTVPGAAIAFATDVSGDGAVIVGSAFTGEGGVRAARWLGGANVGETLDLVVGATDMYAEAVSHDGAYVVGYAVMSGGEPEVGFVWSLEDGVEAISPLPGYAGARATDVSADGGVIVGVLEGSSGVAHAVFVKRAAGAMEELGSVLEDAGFEVSGWSFTSAKVSADGKAVVGRAVVGGATRAYAVIFGCAPDFDGDGFVTGADFDAFVTEYESGGSRADFDADGFVTGVDFDLYVQEFEAGCG